jgi:DeoR/GlpR family transcriptional regulator of sugar metabolism
LLFRLDRVVTDSGGKVLVENGAGSVPKHGRSLLAPQRQAAILEHVRAHGGARVTQLMQRFGVSDMTIRRDLEALAERGLIAKVHGGATALEPHTIDEPGFAAKSKLRQLEKQAIAERAATLVKPQTAIALSAGTTTWTLAPLVTDVPGLTVVTNSVPVADVFYRAGRPDQAVILTGGMRTPSDALVGPFAVATLSSLNFDQVFLGVHGMGARGLTTPNFMEAGTQRALLDGARQRVVLADHTKWDTVGLSTICPLSEVDVLITDDGLAEDARALLAAEVGELIVVPVAR